jgi:uncharacterized protein YjdB
MNKKLLALFMLVFGMVLLAGCGSDDAPPPPVTLTEINISPAEPDELHVNVTKQFTATGKFSDGITQDFTNTATWNSTVPATATIDANGLARGVAAGTTNITASQSGVTSIIAVLDVINPALTGITVSPAAPGALFVGNTQQFTATGDYANGSTLDITNTVTWNSSTPATATIDANGLATGVAVGTTNITASLSGIPSNIVALDVITPPPVTLTGISISPADPDELHVDVTKQFTATGNFSDGTTQDFTNTATWNSTVPATATIDANGLARGVAAGTTNITASQSGVTSNIAVLDVINPALTGITVSPAAPGALFVGNTQQFTATGDYANGSTLDITNSVTWDSSTPATATIDAAGLATGVATGTTNITASLSGISSNIVALDVVTPTLSSISVSPTAVPDGLPVDVTQQFTATGFYTDDSIQDLTTTVIWTSSAPATASVDGNGLATGQAAGTADITASDSGITSNIVALEVINPTLLSINVAPAVVRIELDLGRSLPFQAEGVFDNNQSYDITDYVTWDSSVPAVATIDQSGKATAASAGTTNISASSASFPAVSSNVVALTTELKAQTDLTVEPQNPVALPVGRRQTLVALLRASDGTLQNVTDTARWETSDRNIAGVDNAPSSTAGTVTGFSIGTVTITATDTASGQQDSVDFVVNDATIETVTILPQNPVDLPGGHTQTFTVIGTFSDGVTRILRSTQPWSVSDPRVALIENVTASGGIARLEGLSAGNIDVIYTDWTTDGGASGKQDRVPLTVTLGDLQSIEITPSSPPDVSLAAGSSVQFNATGNYAGGDTRWITEDVIWDSSDTAVGAFDIETKGKLTILPGTANQTTNASASMLNASDILVTSAPTTVTVNTETLDSLYISNLPVVLGETAQFAVTGTFTNGDQSDYTDQVTWSTDDPGVATVSNAEGTKGEVTGVSVGTTVIRAVDPVSSVSTASGITVSQP